MKTEYEYIPVNFENRADAIELADQGKLFKRDSSFGYVDAGNWIFVGRNYDQDGLFFTREEVELPTPQEALREFLDSAKHIDEYFDPHQFLSPSISPTHLALDAEYIQMCCIVADAHRSLMENEDEQ